MKKIKRSWILLLCMSLMLFGSGTVLRAGNIYVSTEGDNSNPGTQGAPLKTLQYALGLVGAGDTLFILEGVYHEEISISGMHGSGEAPIVITAMPGNHVILDGTVPIESGWVLHEGNIYKTTLDLDIWQLFIGNQMMMPARWPNAFLDDGTVWDREHNWGHGNEGPAENGIFVDFPHHGTVSLASSGIDATGAIAVMNIGSWKTWSRDVLTHEPGSSTFTYSTVPAYKDKHHYYFLEGKLELLDAAGEWFFDRASKELYLWMPGGGVPSGEIRGKVQSFVFNIEKSSHIKIEGIDFFATTFYFKNCTHMTVEDCKLEFPSCSRRVLGEHTEPQVTTMFNANTYNPTNNALINCTISYTESQALSFKGKGNRIENCDFYAIDWTVANRPGLMNSIYNDGNNNTFRRNSVELTGASSTLYPGNYPIVELNRVSRTGFLQSDGSITQLTIGAQPNSQTRFNWFHNTVKSGARFDAPIPPTVWGHGGTMRHNVIWETNIGLMQKGEYHFCLHNSVFNCNQNGIVILDGSDGGGGNVGTITRNNFSDKLSGHRSDFVKVPGEADHNWNGYVTNTGFRDQVYDYTNRDFRPRWNSALVDAGTPLDQLDDPFIGVAPDLGAYEFGDTIYWIGGRQLEGASTPVPLDMGSTRYEFVDLMWLEGYKSLSSDVYFGTLEASVNAADRNAAEYMGNQVSNIYNPGPLVEGQTYYWRIDAVKADETVRGATWSFTAGTNANPEVHAATFRVSGLKNGEVSLLEDAIIRLGTRTGKTGEDGQATITMVPQGKYFYRISRKGFTGISDSLHISADTLLLDTLEHTTYDLTFILKDKDSGEVIEGAEVLFDGQILITDSEGGAEIPGLDYGWYDVRASAAGFYPSDSMTVEIYSDSTLELYLMREYLEISARVVDRLTDDPLNRAKIIYGDYQDLTNSSGEAMLDKIHAGKWIYTVEHDYYFPLTDSAIIVGDTTIVIRMTSRTAGIQFEISDKAGPVDGARVELNGSLSLITGSDGMVDFINLLAREKYEYDIQKDGYKTITDSLFLEVDTVVNIMLQPLTGMENQVLSSVGIYPNPVSDELFIDPGELSLHYTVIGPDGKILLMDQSNGERKSIDVTVFAPGIYCIKIRTANLQHSYKLVIK